MGNASIRRLLYDLLEHPTDKYSRGHTVHAFIIGLILLNGLAVVLDTCPRLSVRFVSVFGWFEIFSVAVFTVEYILRLWCSVEANRGQHPLIARLRYVVTWPAIVDALAILPFYLPSLFGGIDLRTLRMLRLFRMVRLLKIGRYSDSLQIMGRVFTRKREEIGITVLAVVLLIVLSSSLMYLAENEAQPDVFGSIPAVMWWAVITLTTVGYGDIYPITILGKTIAGFIALLGLGLIALPTGILASGFMEEVTRRRSGKDITCPHCGQIIDRD